jgi:hypothetical protein
MSENVTLDSSEEYLDIYKGTLSELRDTQLEKGALDANYTQLKSQYPDSQGKRLKDNFQGFRTDFLHSINALEHKFLNQYEQLLAVKGALDYEKEQIEKLVGVKASAETLLKIETLAEQKKSALEEELSCRRQVGEQVFINAKKKYDNKLLKLKEKYSILEESYRGLQCQYDEKLVVLYQKTESIKETEIINELQMRVCSDIAARGRIEGFHLKEVAIQNALKLKQTQFENELLIQKEQFQSDIELERKKFRRMLDENRYDYIRDCAGQGNEKIQKELELEREKIEKERISQKKEFEEKLLCVVSELTTVKKDRKSELRLSKQINMGLESEIRHLNKRIIQLKQKCEHYEKISVVNRQKSKKTVILRTPR